VGAKEAGFLGVRKAKNRPVFAPTDSQTPQAAAQNNILEMGSMGLLGVFC
jgi:hypothetical protein